MDFKELETFLAVVAEQSLNKAADLLYVSQSTVTMRVKSLEEKLGTPLFNRTSRGVTLTERGRLFLPYAERIRRNMEESYHLLAHHKEGRKRLTIGAASAIASYSLPYILGRYVSQEPAVELLCRSGKSNDIFDLVLDGEVDIGLAGAELRHPDIECRTLKSDPVWLLAAPQHPLGQAGRAELADLEQEPLISFSGASPYWKRIEGELGNIGVRLRRAVEMDSVEGIKRIVMQGIGITLLPSLTVREEIEKGQLLHVQMPVYLERPTFLLHRKGVLEDYQRSFAQTCVDYFAEF